MLPCHDAHAHAMPCHDAHAPARMKDRRGILENFGKLGKARTEAMVTKKTAESTRESRTRHFRLKRHLI
jgi:hypothetical protein